jgi:hypothetical protein
MTITVRTQAELDGAIADSAPVIYIESDAGVWLTVRDSGSSYVVARGSSHVVAWGSSHVVARESSRVIAWGSSRVEARGSSHVEAWESSYVEARGSSRVVARGSSHVEAWESSHVVARGSSYVEARGSSHVVAWGSSYVVARESSYVEAWGSSRVVARGSSHVEAWESSRVEAWESSRVEASPYVAVYLRSQRVTLSGGHVIDLTAIDLTDPVQWCEFHGVKTGDGIAYLYKAVGDDWRSDYGAEYAPGTTPEATDWNTVAECGQGLHFCAHPQLSLTYKRDATKFVRVGVRLDEMVPLGDKIKARRVVVACVEVDPYDGEEVKP